MKYMLMLGLAAGCFLLTGCTFTDSHEYVFTGTVLRTTDSSAVTNATVYLASPQWNSYYFSSGYIGRDTASTSAEGAYSLVLYELYEDFMNPEEKNVDQVTPIRIRVALTGYIPFDTTLYSSDLHEQITPMHYQCPTVYLKPTF